MGKKRSGSAFAGLTVGEADVLRSVLRSGADVALHVNGRANHDLFMETHAAMDDIGEARRQRWNRENPGHKIER
jgi:hypothetical protein